MVVRDPRGPTPRPVAEAVGPMPTSWFRWYPATRTRSPWASEARLLRTQVAIPGSITPEPLWQKEEAASRTTIPMGLLVEQRPHRLAQFDLMVEMAQTQVTHLAVEEDLPLDI